MTQAGMHNADQVVNPLRPARVCAANGEQLVRHGKKRRRRAAKAVVSSANLGEHRARP